MGDLDAFRSCAGKNDIPPRKRRKAAGREITISPPLMRATLRRSHMAMAPEAKLR
jgi:hypothetical protein